MHCCASSRQFSFDYMTKLVTADEHDSALVDFDLCIEEHLQASRPLSLGKHFQGYDVALASVAAEKWCARTLRSHDSLAFCLTFGARKARCNTNVPLPATRAHWAPYPMKWCSDSLTMQGQTLIALLRTATTTSM
jgi:hypothetical protein